MPLAYVENNQSHLDLHANRQRQDTLCKCTEGCCSLLQWSLWLEYESTGQSRALFLVQHHSAM